MKSKEYFKEYQTENQEKSPEWRLISAFRKMVLEVSDIAKMRNAKYDSALYVLFSKNNF